MKATDLRLNNLVYGINRRGGVHLPDQIPLRVLQIGIFNSECIKWNLEPSKEEKWMKISNVDLSPIPLTEDWLLRFGFIKNELGFLFPIDGGHTAYSIQMYDDKFGFAYSEDLTKETWIQHVHQLQNLYFALTGEELKIKEEE